MIYSADRTGTKAAEQVKKLAELFSGVPEVEIEAAEKLDIELAALMNIELAGPEDENNTDTDAEILYETGENEYASDKGYYSSDIIGIAADSQNKGADRVAIFNYSSDENEREAFLETVREISRNIDIPFLTGVSVSRFEEIKKAFYTGAEAVFVRAEDISDPAAYKEAADRFGADSIFVKSAGTALSVSGRKLYYSYEEMMRYAEECGSKVNSDEELFEAVFFQLTGIAAIVRAVHKYDAEGFKVHVDTVIDSEILAGKDIMAFKHQMAAEGLNVNTFAGRIAFSELKTDANGLVPCIAQDHKTGEVLMMAYMNEEAFNKTLETGIMTYWSRSRQSLWVKGETSGHFQYVRELKADCDNDTLLAKIVQIGAACHTGARSCFFNEVMRHEYRNTDISSVLRELYEVVCDRKVNPKEGSYTNYLFNKGIDKILKKCGEEATEMVIAAKNPSHEELKYEIADLLYHMTVLMVECGVSWEEVATELANR